MISVNIQQEFFRKVFWTTQKFDLKSKIYVDFPKIIEEITHDQKFFVALPPERKTKFFGQQNVTKFCICLYWHKKTYGEISFGLFVLMNKAYETMLNCFALTLISMFPHSLHHYIMIFSMCIIIGFEYWKLKMCCDLTQMYKKDKSFITCNFLVVELPKNSVCHNLYKNW